MVTTLEDGLTRLLRICPEIMLSSDDIQEIIDGNINKVIANYKQSDTLEVLDIISTANDSDVGEVTIEDDDSVTTIDKSFDDYFKD